MDEGTSVLSSVLENNPADLSLLIPVGALLAWSRRDVELAATCKRALERAANTTVPMTAERTAKICCLRPFDDKALRDAALTLARRAVELGANDSYLPYYHMALGMAEYRAGLHAEAEEELLLATGSVADHPHINGTSAFYLAMCKFRRGKAAEARARASSAIRKMRPIPRAEDDPLLGAENPDDLFLRMAFKEATALLGLDDVPRPAHPSKPSD
jgi:hypothetical protein